MELGELLLLVKTNPDDGTVVVVSEADFIRYMTTDTDVFYPQASASPSSNRAHPGMSGYTWFAENVEELAENCGSGGSVVTYLRDICETFAGYDFDNMDTFIHDPAVYAFVYASALNPNLLTHLAVKGFDSPYPFARDQIIDFQSSASSRSAMVNDTAHAEANINKPSQQRPIWQL